MAATWSALICSQAASASGLLLSQLMPEPVPHMPVPPQAPVPFHMPPPHHESSAWPGGVVELGEGDGVGLPIMPLGRAGAGDRHQESGGEHDDREGREQCLELACHALTILGLGCERCVALRFPDHVTP